ncbi:hypothetical protein C8J57DRAFT_1251667 [Mycena rebaudengoi]|nr:hypothetical protein C8J57DRAFT_1251667 [Mycena rebaudengoi]
MGGEKGLRNTRFGRRKIGSWLNGLHGWVGVGGQERKSGNARASEAAGANGAHGRSRWEQAGGAAAWSGAGWMAGAHGRECERRNAQARGAAGADGGRSGSRREQEGGEAARSRTVSAVNTRRRVVRVSWQVFQVL